MVVVDFFGAEDAADLRGAAELLFVLTVLAFSLVVGESGAVDFVAAVLAPAERRAALVFATGDFRARLDLVERDATEPD